MQSRFYISTLLLALPLLANAKGDISGKVINKDTGEAIDFATVQLVNPDTGKPLPIITTTDTDGSFTLSGVDDGNYIVKVINLGSIDQERPVKISGANVDLGTLRLANDTKVLQEVVVEGVRSQMRFELDKKVFTVDSNIASAGQSASELLESIPSVEVDQDGEVSLRGNSSVTVWINGKESGLSADNRAQILEQIPAETIDRIEVVTNPSAKYSPEGTAGIINIILKKNRKAGYFGSAEIGANTRGGGNAGFNINVNASKWDVFAGIGFRMRHNTAGSLTRRTMEDGTFLNSDASSPNHGNNIFVRLGATYHITDNDDIGLSGFGMFGHRWSHSLTTYTTDMPGMWRSNSQLTRSNGNNRGGHGELTYTHRWSDNHTLDVTGSFNHWGGPSWTSYLQHPDYADESLNHDVYQEQTQNIGVNSWEAKIDYTNQFNSWLKLEAGFNGNYGREDSPVDTWQGTSPEDAVLYAGLTNRFIYHNNISALYATLGGKVNDFSFSAGLRGESWQIRTKSLGLGESEADQQWYKKNNFALFPSLFLSYSLPYDNEIQINYTRRIRRPWGGQLNSFRNISDATNISFGNPELEPQYANAFELNYIKSWTWHMISLSAYVRTSNNTMNRISYMDGDILYSTWANVANNTNSGVEIVGKNSLFNGKLDLTTTVNLYNNSVSAWNYTYTDPQGQQFHLSRDKQHSFAWDARLMASVKLPWSLSFQATGRYNSRQLEAQGQRDAGWNVDAGLRRVFGDWSISINCRDVFDSRRWKSTLNGPGYSQYSERWRGGRNVRLTVKYAFGNMKQKPQRRPDGEPDSDAMDSGSNYSGEAEM